MGQKQKVDMDIYEDSSLPLLNFRSLCGLASFAILEVEESRRLLDETPVYRASFTSQQQFQSKNLQPISV
jgi:hypothetical protein